MSVFDKTRYVRALFVILPFGCLLMYYGIKSQFDLPKKQELQKISGVVLKTEVKKEYSKNYEVMIDRKRLFIVGYDESYIFNKSKDFELFQKFLSKDDSVTIWKNTKNYPYTIEQFSKGDTMILEYKRIDIAGLVFAGFGLIALIISILYIFKHPEDLKGEEETE